MKMWLKVRQSNGTNAVRHVGTGGTNASVRRMVVPSSNSTALRRRPKTYHAKYQQSVREVVRRGEWGSCRVHHEALWWQVGQVRRTLVVTAQKAMVAGKKWRRRAPASGSPVVPEDW